MLVGCQNRIQRSLRFQFGLMMLLLTVLSSSYAHAQNRVDLDDLTIKGELLNDNRLRMSAREMQKITDRVSYRENFRKEATDGLEVAWPEQEAPADSNGGGQ